MPDSNGNNGDWVMPANAAFVLLRFGACYDNGVGGDISYFAFPSVRLVCVEVQCLRLVLMFRIVLYLTGSTSNG